ncbi:MAG: host-nuclease inhibitor Gam family protein [Planctomycetota bacterium]
MELRAWLDQELTARGARQKSINLPAGRIGVRTRAAKFVIDNEPATLDWARKHCPEAVVLMESISKSKLNKHVESTGELPDGTSLQPAHEALYIS